MRPHTFLWTAAAAAAIAALPVRADERSTARRFEEAREDEPSLIAFLQEMPKGGDLHNHTVLDPEEGVREAVKHGLFFDPATNRFESEQRMGLLPAADLLRNDRLRYGYLNLASMRGWQPGGAVSGHDHFFATFAYNGSPWQKTPDEEALATVIRRAQLQRLQYLELMAAPGSAALGRMRAAVLGVTTAEEMWTKVQPLLEEHVRAARAELDMRDRKVAELCAIQPPLSSADRPMTVRYLASGGRLGADGAIFATWAATFALMKADRRVVGVNLVAPEDHPIAQERFGRQMELLDFLRKRFDHPNVTLHAGELNPWISPLPDMTHHIRGSIEVGHARRIGHGNAIAWEKDVRGLLRKMRDEGIAVEVCPTSEAVILGQEADRHPFRLYWNAGVPVTLNTDDDAILRTNMTLEFVRAARQWNLSYPDLKRLARNSIEYSFLPGESLFLDHDYRRIRPPLAGLKRHDWAPTSAEAEVLAESDKATVQARLERAFVEFEK